MASLKEDMVSINVMRTKRRVAYEISWLDHLPRFGDRCCCPVQMNSKSDIESEISHAIELDDSEALRGIIDSNSLHGFEMLSAWLSVAVQLGYHSSLEVLVDSGANVVWANNDGETAFSYACASNEFAIAKYLHEHGAEINSVDSSGATPLDWAVCHGQPEFRQWLREVGGTRKLDHDEWPWPPNTTIK